MAINYDNLLTFLKEYKQKKDFQPLICLLKNTLDGKQRISVDINEYLGQQYCSTLTDILNELDPNNIDDINAVEIICECLIQQVTSNNVRWYILERCQLLYYLTRQFLAFTNVTIKIKIAKTLQTYLIYSPLEGKKLLSQEFVSELFKQLVNILRGNHPQEFNEASLGLLASLCQIWSHCQEVMNVIDDYQVLRKQLLRFLSAEMVKRTTIVYTMTIMFHLCNSDDRLFNKRNIRQTLQVLFNIMLNGDTGWASLYAASLLTEICKSSRTSHLLAEYRSLPLSLKETLNQLNTKDKITSEKYFEFILTIAGINADYRHILTDVVMPKESACENIWEKEYNDINANTEILDTIIQLISSSDMTISIYAMRLLNDIYMDVLSTNKEAKLPKLNVIGDVIHQFLSTVCSNSPNKSHGLLSGDKNHPGKFTVEYCIKNRQQSAILMKVKGIMQFVTDLLIYGDKWLDHATSFINCTDKIIRDQLESNHLSNNMDLSNNQMIFKLSSLGVDIFIDLLYFYYRATETKPSSNLFGERLKSHLEQPSCPIMLAFALSAASQNQLTLQRALVLQGVCLHLQDFNIEMMGEKMYKFSSEYSMLKFKDSSPNPPFDSKVLFVSAKPHSLTESADGDTGFHVDANNQLLQSMSINEVPEFYTKKPEILGLHVLKSNLNKKVQLNQLLSEGDIHKTESPKMKSNESPFSDCLDFNTNVDQLDSLGIDTKIQQIVRRWMEKPDSTFSTDEIYLIFEHRIQSMQNHEALMEEIVSNKTAALHQSEALLNTYRSKLMDAEKESKQLRNLQVEIESKINFLNNKIDIQSEKIVEMEKINQTLIETNRIGEKQKDDCLTISKKLQEKLLKVSDEKMLIEKSLEDYCKQIEEANKLIAARDNQISNYTQMTKLINKLTGNKFSVENTFGTSGFDELNKTMTSSVLNEFESQANTNISTAGNYCANNNNTISVSPDSNHVMHMRTISNHDFLQLYKNNCRILHSHK